MSQAAAKDPKKPEESKAKKEEISDLLPEEELVSYHQPRHFASLTPI